MLRSGTIRIARAVCGFGFACWMTLALLPDLAHAQTVPEAPNYSRKNSFGFLAAYSNDSSHMLLGVAENRRLLNFGAMYSRRLLQNRIVNWQYNAEILPVALESDPVDHYSITFTTPPEGPFTQTIVPIGACHNDSGSGNYVVGGVTYDYTFSDTCARRWTIGEGISPIGFQWNFLPRRKLQPIVLGHGGYMYSTQPIPTTDAGSFNFTFDFGAGFEFYRTKTQSVRVDYRYHHISDHYTTTENPGIDNGLFTVTYSFGR
jgi:opacity protein-like surface antigen